MPDLARPGGLEGLLGSVDMYFLVPAGSSRLEPAGPPCPSNGLSRLWPEKQVKDGFCRLLPSLTSSVRSVG